VKDAFDIMLREFCGTRPVEEVAFGANPKTGLSGHLAEATLRVSGEVVIQNVVIRPEAHEGRHGDNRGTIGTEKVEYVLERIDWIRKMLQDIQHQDQGIAFSRLKTRIEGTDIDAGAMGIALAHELCAGFYTFHVAKFGKPLKKEAVTATNVQNVPSSYGRRKRTQRFHDEFCPGTPPPVL
jgi:hypothetical protein